MAKESRNSGHSLQSQGGFDYNGRRKRRGAVRSGREEYTKMIDINLIRKNPDVVRENIRKKFQDSKLVLVDEVIELDRANREAMQKADSLRNQRKVAGKNRGGRTDQGAGGRAGGGTGGA